MLIYLFVLIYGIVLGYFGSGMIFGEMFVVGSRPGRTPTNFNLNHGSPVNPYHFTGTRARLTSLGLTFVLGFFGFAGLSGSSFKGTKLIEVLKNDPTSSLVLLFPLIAGIIIGLFIVFRERPTAERMAASLQDTASSQSHGTTRIID